MTGNVERLQVNASPILKLIEIPHTTQAMPMIHLCFLLTVAQTLLLYGP